MRGQGRTDEISAFDFYKYCEECKVQISRGEVAGIFKVAEGHQLDTDMPMLGRKEFLSYMAKVHKQK